MDSKKLAQRYDLILEQEQVFVKRVIYLMRAFSPAPWWHFFIPFKFLLEYFARKKDVSSFSKVHLYLKQIALDSAYQNLLLDQHENPVSEMEAKLRDFLIHMHGNQSHELFEQLKIWLTLFQKHYDRLLQAQERYYLLMVQKAYHSRMDYKAFFEQLAEVEKRIDQVILAEQQDKESARRYFLDKQKAFEQVRERELRDAFGAT